MVIFVSTSANQIQHPLRVASWPGNFHNSVSFRGFYNLTDQAELLENWTPVSLRPVTPDELFLTTCVSLHTSTIVDILRGGRRIVIPTELMTKPGNSSFWEGITCDLDRFMTNPSSSVTMQRADTFLVHSSNVSPMNRE